jgi:hypothetical protein
MPIRPSVAYSSNILFYYSGLPAILNIYSYIYILT